MITTSYHQLPIWRDAMQLLVLLEEAVRHFPRYYKYTLGSNLRQLAMRVCQLIVRSYHHQGNGRQRLLEQLVASVDDLKIYIQLAKEVKAFASFQIFQTASLLAVKLGRQGGGWLKRIGSEVAPR